MDIATAIEMLARLEHMIDELEATAGARIVVDVHLETSVRLEALTAGVEQRNGGG